jgi:signal transduction histidine kinase
MAGRPPFWRTVAFKLSALTSALVLFVIALMAQSLFRQAEQGLINEMSLRSEFFARGVREAIFPKLDAFQLHFQVEQMRREKAVTYAAVADAEGKVLSHSDSARIGGRVDLKRPPLLRLGGAYDLAAPVMLGPKQVGTVLLGFDQSSLQEALAGTRRRIALVAAASILAAVLGTVLIVGFITRPLPGLAAAAAQVGRGNFDVRVESRSGDEIGVLARAFNDMTVANALLFKTLREEKEKIEVLFNSTLEGLVWVDPGGRVLLMNPAARDLLACRDRAAASLQDAAAGFEAAPPLAELLASKRRVQPFELMRKEPKTLILAGVADRLGGEGEGAGRLLIFRDATLEKRGETLARNFLSIVSHKLKTPLAVALGYLDLLDGEKVTAFQRQALDKIRSEDEKLRRLVEKLLVFAAVQSPERIVLDKSLCTAADVVDAALKAAELPKGAVLSRDAEALKALPAFKADFLLVKEALANLLENAAKFNPKERKQVRVAVTSAGALLRVTVADDGPGIPSEEQPKLFRRFYQIDPDFTGQVPGMGLGLAFVKSVAEAHGGAAGLRSAPGQGSEFFFTLPI